MKLGRLRLGLQRTNESRPTYTIASWAYVTGYWRWAIWWTPPTSFRDSLRFGFGPSMACGTKWSAGHGSYGGWTLIPLVGSFNFSTQPRFDAMLKWRSAAGSS